MVVFERVREVGILAALGMKRQQILALFLTEAALLGLAGAALGIGLGLVGLAYLAVVGIPIGEMAAAAGNMAISTTMRARVMPGSILLLSAWTLVVILLAALYPAWFAARLSPAAALHRS
jgi:ABC-type antimicrobial peptide transport system permease subunit